MITREQKRRLGFFVVFSSLLLGFILFLFIYPKLQKEGKIYIIDFINKSVNGLNKGSDVKYQGVMVGKVAKIMVNKENLSSILVYIELKNNFPVKKDMTATMQYAGITGLKYIEIEGGGNSSAELLEGSKIQVGKGFGEKAENIVKNIDTAINNINKLIGKENEAKVNVLLENLKNSSKTVDTVLKKKKKSISKIIDSLELTSEKLSNFVGSLNEFSDKLKRYDLKDSIEGFNTMVKNISDRFSKEEFGKMMKNTNILVSDFTVILKKMDMRIQKIENDFIYSMENIKESLDNIKKFTRDLVEDPTSLLIKKSRKRRRK